MSGIFGIIDASTNEPSQVRKLLSTMEQKVVHRPWHQVESYFGEDCRVGIGRIGIGIFNSESQPVFSEDRSIALVLAGEFINQAQLRLDLQKSGYSFRDGSQAELALVLYQAKGISFVKEVEGIFIGGIWDRSQDRLIIFNDRFGFKPLYYASYARKFVFSPEMKAILADHAFVKKLNRLAISEYMRFQLLLGEKTFFEDLKLLPPGSFLVVDCTSLRVNLQEYWNWNSIRLRQESIDEVEAVEETHRLLSHSVNRCLEGISRPGVFLSGGLDSRLLLALAGRDYKGMTTITYGQRDCRDVHLARRVARALSTQHYHFDFPDGNWVKEIAEHHLDLVEGGHSWIHAHGLSVLPAVRELIDVNLSGIGGGVNLGDTFTHPSLVVAPDEEAFTTAMFLFYNQQHTWPGITEAEEQTLYTGDYATDWCGLAYDSLRNELSTYDHPDFAIRSLAFNTDNHVRRLIANFLTFYNVYIEFRCPYYDYRLVEWTTGLPVQLRKNRYMQKLILTRAVPRLSLIPYDKDYLLPTGHHLLRDAHAGFRKVSGYLARLAGGYRPRPTLYADYEHYLRTDLRQWGEQILFDKRTLDRGIFNPDALRSLWDRHQSGHEEWTIGKIAPIMTFEMMLREFLD